MQPALLLLIAAAYLLLLFGVAHWGDNWAEKRQQRLPGWVWSLSLAVYATSWTYYGAVGRAAESTWSYLPIYLGPILVFVFGHGLLRRIIQIAKDNNLTSLADFVAARYGGDQSIARLITLVSVVAVLPYIALQLKAVVTSFAVLAPSTGGAGIDLALLTATALGFFAILFGTRHISATEKHHGLVVAVAFESIVKLLAFVLVAGAVLWVTRHNPWQMNLEAWAQDWPQTDGLTFAVHTFLAGLAVICLPRQFHLTVVESDSAENVSDARWILPVYLMVISFLVVPLTGIGLRSFSPEVDADTYMLRLPLSLGLDSLGTLVFLGGFSAATAMVIVASIALSIMVSNELVMPQVIRHPRWSDRRDLGRVLKTIRRVTIIVLLALAYLFYQWMAVKASLATTGLIAFVGIAQLAPALFGAVYWRGGNRNGVLWGLSLGTALWGYTLLLPGFFSDASWLIEGPHGVRVLAPYGLLGLSGIDPVVHGAFWSLGLNLLGFVLVSRLTRTTLIEQLDSARFSSLAAGRAHAVRVSDLRVLLERFYGPERSESLLAEFWASSPEARREDEQTAPASLVDFVERLLAGAMGASTARTVVEALLSGSSDVMREVVRAIDQASDVVRFNRDLLQATLDNLSQGVSVIDADLRLVAWNRGYQSLFNFPEGLLKIGEPIENILRHNAEAGLLGPGSPDAQVSRRMQHLRARHPHRHERRMPDGRVVEVRGEPMPGGGFVSTFSDITDYQRAQDELRSANIRLEQRVAERTSELEKTNQLLERAREVAEAANLGKTRFLAAAGHDLMQPLNAARLFASTLAPELKQEQQKMVRSIEQSMSSMEALLSDLLDISKLDAGVWETRPRPVRLQEVFSALETEFDLLARAKGLRLRVHRCSGVVYTDPVLLRRVIQNFLANAIRYTGSGRVVLGARRVPGAFRIEVWDTGVGIAPADQQRIFAEFSRLGDASETGADKGLGLGLAICARIANLLEHPLRLHSVPGRGSCFNLTVPGTALAAPAPQKTGRVRPIGGARLKEVPVLCVDNDEEVLNGMMALLNSWGASVKVAKNRRASLEACVDWVPQLLLVDYHLDAGDTGIEVVKALRESMAVSVPAIVITADATTDAAAAASAANLKLLRKPVKPAALRALMTSLL